MTRKKVDLTYIANDAKRRATFKKRKSGLIKKVDEISTLCGIEACAIIYHPNEPQPEVWPSPWGARRVISEFMKMPELEQSKKMLTQESFLRQRIQKAQEQLKKQRTDNKKKEMNHLMFQCLSAGEVFDSANMIDLNDLSWLIDQNLKDVNRKINRIQGQEGSTDEVVAINGEQEQVEAMQKQPCSVDNIINDGGVHEMQPFGDATNLQNCYWPTPFNP